MTSSSSLKMSKLLYRELVSGMTLRFNQPPQAYLKKSVQGSAEVSMFWISREAARPETGSDELKDVLLKQVGKRKGSSSSHQLHRGSFLYLHNSPL